MKENATFQDIVNIVDDSQDPDDLKQKLQQKFNLDNLDDFYIDVKDPEDPLMSAAAYFAKIKNEKVNWLLALGADKKLVVYGLAKYGDIHNRENVNNIKKYVKKHPDTFSEMIIGFAEHGISYEEITKIAISIKKPLDPSEILQLLAEGYARKNGQKSDKFDKFKQIEDLISKNENYKTEIVNAAIKGYAFIGNKDQIKKICEEMPVSEVDKNLPWPEIIKALAIRGHRCKDIIKDIEENKPVDLKSINSKEQHNYLLECYINMASGYAQGGHHQEAAELYGENSQVNEYLKQAGLNIVTAIASGYIATGDHQRAFVLCQQSNNSFADVAKLYAELKNDKQIEKYYNSNSSKEVARAIAEGYKKNDNYGKSLHYILEAYLKTRHKVLNTRGEIKNYFYNSLIPFQKSFSEKQKAVIALQDALNGKSVQLADHLAVLRNGNLGKEIRSFLKSSNINVTIDGVKVRITTVRDLVRELDKGNKDQIFNQNNNEDNNSPVFNQNDSLNDNALIFKHNNNQYNNIHKKDFINRYDIFKEKPTYRDEEQEKYPNHNDNHP